MKGKADAEKVNKQTRKQRTNATKIKLLRNSKCQKRIPYQKLLKQQETRAKIQIKTTNKNLRQVVGTKVDERVTTGVSRLRYL